MAHGSAVVPDRFAGASDGYVIISTFRCYVHIPQLVSLCLEATDPVSWQTGAEDLHA